jgi:hypothetical protein
MRASTSFFVRRKGVDGRDKPGMTMWLLLSCPASATIVNAPQRLRRFALAAGFFAFAAGLLALAGAGFASTALPAATIASASSTRFAQ